MYPDAPLIQRQGEVDAWDNAEFRAAIRAANKSQIIMAGIVTDVCESPYPSFLIVSQHTTTTSSTDTHVHHARKTQNARPSAPCRSARRATPSGPTLRPPGRPRR